MVKVGLLGALYYMSAMTRAPASPCHLYFRFALVHVCRVHVFTIRGCV